MMCILNQIALRKAIDYQQEMIQTFLIPGVSSAVMGVVTFFVYRGIYLLLHTNLAAIILSIAASMVVYALMLVRLKGITEEEIYQFPKGTTLVHLFKKMHIL
jgi:stage V sporulation protein B